jgi:hypothetical protein
MLQQSQAQSLFGWNISFDYNFLNTLKNLNNVDTLKSIAQDLSPVKAGGVSLGIPVNIKIAHWILLRPQVVFNISLGQLDYKMSNGTTQTAKFPSMNLEFPVQSVISNYNKTHGFGLIFGIRGGYKVKDLSGNQLLTLSKGYGTLDAGAGYRFKIGKKTTLMPELRYSFGLNDMLKQDAANVYAYTLDHIRRNRVSFVLNFF